MWVVVEFAKYLKDANYTCAKDFLKNAKVVTYRQTWTDKFIISERARFHVYRAFNTSARYRRKSPASDGAY